MRKKRKLLVMILSFTGHRKLFNQYYPHKIWNPICAEVVRVLEELKPDLILSGMAVGFDFLACDASISLGIPFHAICPFKGQETAWPQKSQERYRNFLDKADKVIIVSEGGYSAEKMYIRNRYLVDNSDQVLACWNGEKGGTYDTVHYTIFSADKPITNVYLTAYP